MAQAQNNFRTLSKSRKDMYLIALEDITIQEGFNVREDFGDIDELALSLAENGQLQPLTIGADKNGGPVVIDGHRRMMAFKIAQEKYGAEIKSAWCIPEQKGANEETRIVDLFVRNNGKPLTIIEQASVIKRLTDYNWTMSDIAKKIGKTRAYINDVLGLSSAPKEVRDVVREGLISPTAGLKLAQAPKAKQDSVLQKIQTLCSDTAGKKIKVSAADIEKEVKGEASMVSSKLIRNMIKKIEPWATTGKHKEQWIAVLYGLELALGKKELNPSNFS